MVHCAVISAFDRSEDPVGWRKHAVLDPNNELWNLTDEVVAHIARSRIVGGVEMSWSRQSFIFDLEVIEVFELFEAMLVDCSNGLGQISVELVVFEIKVPIVVVQNPGEYRVLR